MTSEQSTATVSSRGVAKDADGHVAGLVPCRREGCSSVVVQLGLLTLGLVPLLSRHPTQGGSSG